MSRVARTLLPSTRYSRTLKAGAAFSGAAGGGACSAACAVDASHKTASTPGELTLLRNVCPLDIAYARKERGPSCEGPRLSTRFSTGRVFFLLQLRRQRRAAVAGPSSAVEERSELRARTTLLQRDLRDVSGGLARDR